MKILCLSTLDKFSRFYLDIEKQLCAKNKYDIDLKVYSVYFSGFLYTLLRFKFSTWISVKAWYLAKRKRVHYKNVIHTSREYKGLIYNDFIKFHLGLNKNISPLSLQLQALAYIDIFEDIFETERPNYLISIGDSRLYVEAAIAVAKQKNVKVFYIEQGPFNTTFFDEAGVNANLSIRNNSNYNLVDSNYQQNNNIIKQKKYGRSPIYRGIDMLLKSLFERNSIYPPDLKHTDLNTFKPKSQKNKSSRTANKNGEQTFLLILQVPLDVNMIYHSPHFNSHTEIIKSIYAQLPENSKLLVREHPLYINKYESELYDFIIKNEILIDNASPLNKAIENAQVVIVNNSTVGIEAIFNYKPVVVLGNAFYDYDLICLKLKDKNDLNSVLKNALDYSANKNEIDNFKQLLYNTVLLEGAITDKDLNSPKLIANHLLANH
jgi:capsular polysaccharide export protein